MNYKNQIVTPDEKLIFTEPEMEIVRFDESDISTAFESQFGFGGNEDGFGDDEGIPEI